MTTAYLDPRTGTTYPIDQPRWCGPDLAPLLLTPMAGIIRGGIEAATRSLWRYRAALPLAVNEPITMGEGCTPLIRRTIHGASVHLKCEWFMPTGSFKDRGASVMLSMLRQQGVTAVLEDSSGNGGAAVSWRVPGINSTAAPWARICTVFAGLVESGAMMVARSPPAAA